MSGTLKGETAPAPLPPSVEAAYKKKCIQLKKRLNEIEADNGAKRLRIDRNKRFIEKMRLEQAIMLEHLGKIQQKKGLTPEGLPVFDFDAGDPDSEGSSEGPPTPNEKPLRSKRSHRRALPSPPPGGSNNPTPGIQQHDPQPYPYPPLSDYERDSLRHYTTDFDPNIHQPPKIDYDPSYHGTFRDHNANPLTEFETWVLHCRRSVPQEFAHLPEDERMQKAHWAWRRLLGEKELARMKGEYEERVEDWYARRAEWEMASARERERQGGSSGGGGGEGVPPGGLRGGEGLKVEEGDEEMAGGRGGFTAVNG
ncbi:MAG: hypothetical protein LQ339_000874 [Xanthoria mediterranea]|nr:MAG: hypothetical protein LQ339_000874 [Xanthoria mediterranea]